MLRVLCVGLVAVGCGNPPPASKPEGHGSAAAVSPDAAVPADAAPLDRDYPRLAARGVALYQDVVKAFAAAGEDCAAAAASLVKVQQTYADVIAANAKVLHEGRAKELKAALAPFDAQFDAAARAIVESPTLSTCSQDAAFARAFDFVGTPP